MLESLVPPKNSDYVDPSSLNINLFFPMRFSFVQIVRESRVPPVSDSSRDFVFEADLFQDSALQERKLLRPRGCPDLRAVHEALQWTEGTRYSSLAKLCRRTFLNMQHWSSVQYRCRIPFHEPTDNNTTMHDALPVLSLHNQS